MALMLIFHLGPQHYALETHSVVEIIHRVELNKVHGMPANMAGRFNYHGQIVPVLDMSQLLGGRPSRPALGTRIVLVQSAMAAQGQPAIDSTADSQLLGLLVEQVTETLEAHQLRQVDEGDRDAQYPSQHPYVGKTLLHEQQMIQCLRTNKLFAELGYNAVSGAVLN